MSSTTAHGHGPAKRPMQKLHEPRKGEKPLPMPALLLDATEEPDIVTIPARSVLAFDGEGAPETDAFKAAFGALYGVAFTLEFARKAEGAAEFKIGPLEGKWWAALEGTAFLEAPRESWRWRLRIAMPEDMTETEVAIAIRAVTTRKGGKLEGDRDTLRVRLERVPAQRVVRALHVGPYAEERRTFERMARACEAAHVAGDFAHVEVYLSDPRRTPPAKLKTVLLREVR